MLMSNKRMFIALFLWEELNVTNESKILHKLLATHR